MLAKNAFWLIRDGVVALFNTLRLSPVFLTMDEFKRIQRGEYSDTEREILTEHGLVAFSNEPTIEQFRKDYCPEDEVMTLYLLLTRECNLACDYCFEVERKGVHEYGRGFMSASTAIKAVDIFALEYAQNKRDWNYQIILYGGEPSLNWTTLKAVVTHIKLLQAKKLLPEKLLLAMNTNGTLTDKEKACFLAANDVSVCVSLDGTKEVHDLHRKDNNGNGTFELAISGYKNLVEADAKVCPSLTISSEVVSNTLEMVKSLHEKLGFKALGLNPLMCDQNCLSIDHKEYERLVAREIIKIFNWGRENNVSEDRALRKVRSFVNKEPHIADCCAYGQQIVVQPNGSIGICHASKEHDYCTIWDYKSPHKTELAKKWIDRLPIMNSKCESCEAIYICGGGCAHSAKLLKGSTAEIDEGFCEHSKTMLEFLVWDLYEKMVARNAK